MVIHHNSLILMGNRIKRLSKSQYLKGLQCPKALWLYRHRPDLAPPISEQKQWLFDSGQEVAILAHAYFENGHLIDEPYFETGKAIESTNRSIANGQNVIFEATSSSQDGAYSRIDILHKITGKKKWDLIEVKQSTGIKDYHVDDIPLFDNSSPYQQIPFQFSLHIQQKRGGELTHIEFLHTAMTDPRSEFVSALIEYCGTEGSVIVYNMGFESRINRELSVIFLQYSAKLETINSRMIDLLVPFRTRNLYHYIMKGSASLKSVIPALIPDLTYDDLAITDGAMASRNYLKCLKNMVSDDAKSEIYDNLRRYCKMDTYAEVRLMEKLHEFSGKSV